MTGPASSAKYLPAWLRAAYGKPLDTTCTRYVVDTAPDGTVTEDSYDSPYITAQEWRSETMGGLAVRRHGEPSMSTDRDELAELIASAEYPNMNPPWAERKDRSPVKYYSRKYADVLIAAGYRKPRTITTVEELEALPDLSVILDVDRDVSQLRGRSWCGYEMADLTHPMMAKYLPATVLWEPLP